MFFWMFIFKLLLKTFGDSWPLAAAAFMKGKTKTLVKFMTLNFAGRTRTF